MPPTSTDTPQCPICHEAITPSMKLVVSPDCGHVMCLACSERFFAGLKRKGCPMCRNPTKPDSLVPVYVDFRSSTTNRTHESDCVEERMKDATDSLSKAAFSNGDIVKSEDREFRSTLELQGTHVIGILKSCLHPEEGQLSASRDRNDQGQIFTRTGKFLTNVAKASDITGAIRGILHEIGAQLREYQETYHAISSIIDTRERLQKQVDDLKARLANEELNHVRDVDQITNNASENARQLQDDAKERETELHRQMARLRDDLRAETLMRKKAVQWEIELVREVDKYKIKAYNNRKKLLAERKHSAELQRRVDKMSGGSPRRLPLPSSDDSLEIEGLEDEIVEGPPPSGNLPTSQGTILLSRCEVGLISVRFELSTSVMFSANGRVLSHRAPNLTRRGAGKAKAKNSVTRRLGTRQWTCRVHKR
ncbi:hypothetical protein BD410DRAFT_304508 [Rickenella mellea]|uniref:RING-type domain-containing protein n=1 Tax=Rickenella mellea TaxID=50990 RepID=A0A4Y7Q1Y0_9AGAM|nr:hypothetical protein BD410DRAFT_304508 [Rickenella mellea]